jgi:hypothetical protein
MCRFIIILIFTASVILGQNVDKEAIIKSLKQTEAEWDRAMLDEDISSLQKFVSEESVLAIANGQIAQLTKEQIVNNLQRQFKNGTYVQFEDSASVYGVSDDGSLAWGAGIGTRYYIQDGRTDTSVTTSASLTILRNTEGTWSLIAQSISDKPNLITPEAVQLDPSTLSEYAGTYHSKISGNTYNITPADGMLVFDNGERRNELFPQTAEVFFVKNGSHRLVFMRDGNGKVTHYLWLGQGKVYRVDKIE